MPAPGDRAAGGGVAPLTVGGVAAAVRALRPPARPQVLPPPAALHPRGRLLPQPHPQVHHHHHTYHHHLGGEPGGADPALPGGHHRDLLGVEHGRAHLPGNLGQHLQHHVHQRRLLVLSPGIRLLGHLLGLGLGLDLHRVGLGLALESDGLCLGLCLEDGLLPVSLGQHLQPVLLSLGRLPD